MMNRKIAVIIVAACLPVVLFYVSCVHYQHAYHVAIMWNKYSGNFWLEEKSGFHLSYPWVFAARIDTRPINVGIPSASRSFNRKLVKFNPAAYKEFVAVEGTRYYWWDNLFSLNTGYNEEYRGMKDVLRGYAYSLKKYSFVTVLENRGDSD